MAYRVSLPDDVQGNTRSKKPMEVLVTGSFRWIAAALSCAAIVCSAPAVAQDASPDSTRLLDPEIAQGVARGFAPGLFDKKPFESYRVPDSLRLSQKMVPGLPGEPPVRIVIVEPRDAAPGHPALLDIHGGGYTMGTADFQIADIAVLAERLGITVVTVDYRLAPATRYPGSLHDNYAALRWLHANAATLGVDPARLAIMGGSAGGGHAAALALFAQEKREVPIVLQVLVAPMLDDRTGSTVDPGPYAGQFVWKRDQNRAGWTALLGTAPGGYDVPVGAAPARTRDFSRFPPTFLLVGALDLFAAEDIEFALKLLRAGVPTELHVYPGGVHASEILAPNATVTRNNATAIEQALRRALDLAPSSQRP